MVPNRAVHKYVSANVSIHAGWLRVTLWIRIFSEKPTARRLLQPSIQRFVIVFTCARLSSAHWGSYIYSILTTWLWCILILSNIFLPIPVLCFRHAFTPITLTQFSSIPCVLKWSPLILRPNNIVLWRVQIAANFLTPSPCYPLALCSQVPNFHICTGR